MELSLFDILGRLQEPHDFGERKFKFVILAYEEPKFYMCDTLEEKFKTWKGCEIETINGIHFLCVVTDTVYYLCLTNKARKYFGI
jgi:hypothetical protein